MLRLGVLVEELCRFHAERLVKVPSIDNESDDDEE
jgi:hypothetical protein